MSRLCAHEQNLAYMANAVSGAQDDLLSHLLPERAAAEVDVPFMYSDDLFGSLPTEKTDRTSPSFCACPQGLSSSVLQEYLDRLETRKGHVRLVVWQDSSFCIAPRASH